MVSIAAIARTIAVGSALVSAAVPPDTCDANELRVCLQEFEQAYLQLEPGDRRAKCQQVITSGANCFAPCPQQDMTEFIATYDNGLCASYDPFLTRRGINDGDSDEQPQPQQQPQPQRPPQPQPRKDSLDLHRNLRPLGNDSFSPSLLSRTQTDNINQGDAKPSPNRSHQTGTDSPVAVTTFIARKKAKGGSNFLTSSAAATATSPPDSTQVDPEEYHARLSKSRYKENLRSIRSRQAMESSLAALNLMSARPSATQEPVASAAPASAFKPASSRSLMAMASKAVETAQAPMQAPTPRTQEGLKSQAVALGSSKLASGLLLMACFIFVLVACFD